MLEELGRAPTPAEHGGGARGRLPGRVLGPALLVAVGAVLLMVLLRKKDVEDINPEAAAVPGA